MGSSKMCFRYIFTFCNNLFFIGIYIHIKSDGVQRTCISHPLIFSLKLHYSSAKGSDPDWKAVLRSLWCQVHQKDQPSLSWLQCFPSLSEGWAKTMKNLLREHFGKCVKELVRKCLQVLLATAFALLEYFAGGMGHWNKQTNVIPTEAVYCLHYTPDIDSRPTVHVGIHLWVG